MKPDLRRSRARDLVWLLLRRYERRRVTGESMQPLLNGGDEVLVDRFAYRGRLPAAGEIVLLLDPRDNHRPLIKRIQTTLADGRYVVTGDNPGASTDSRHFGAVAPEQIIGKVICRFE